MDKGLQLYKELVDDLVKRRDDVVAKRVREKQLWPDTASDNLMQQNRMIDSLTDEDE